MTELDTQIHDLKQHIKKLKEELLTKEKLLYDLLLIKNQKPTFNNVLTTDEVVRYSRQMIMPDVTLNGQIALKNSKVLIVGVGGLGCPSSLYLAAAGVGEITLIDYDTVELSNLHRQILHFEADLNMPKVESAYQKLKRQFGFLTTISSKFACVRRSQANNGSEGDIAEVMLDEEDVYERRREEEYRRYCVTGLNDDQKKISSICRFRGACAQRRLYADLVDENTAMAADNTLFTLTGPVERARFTFTIPLSIT